MTNYPAGSKVVVTNADEGETYKNGEIYTVLYPESPGVNVLVGDQERYLASYEFEAYTSTKFKEGDKVIVQPDPEWGYEGRTGTVTSVDAYDSGLPYYVKWDDGSYALYMREVDLKLLVAPEPLAEWEKELLEVRPRQIAFADIQKDDLIKAEFAQNGVKRTHEGVAGDFTYGDWFSPEGDFVANESWNATYTLLERPEPPKPNPFAEAKVGSIATRNRRGVKYLKKADNAWALISETGGVAAYGNTDSNMLEYGGGITHVTYSAP